jgi:hypothetical protein
VLSDDHFAKQFYAGMADLLGELEISPDMQAQVANMLKEVGGGCRIRRAVVIVPAEDLQGRQALNVLMQSHIPTLSRTGIIN